ncbi:MAG TPA: leucyl aminopeptidase [Acidimicrobiales bacterium]|nr:leucyl aminopeptidase [Acidimicrobiales bacterium]
MPPITFVAARDVPTEAPVLAVPVFGGLSMADGAPVELDLGYLERIGFEAKAGQSQVLPADDGSVVVAVGMGEREQVDDEAWRKAGAAVADAAGRFADVAVALPRAEGVGAAGALAEGLGLAAYRYSTYKSDPPACRIERVSIVGGGATRLQAALDRAASVVSAVAMARDLVNEPAGSLSPSRLAEVAVEVGKAAGLQVRVLDENQLARERMGALLGVGMGSSQPPRLIEMRYEPEGRARGHVALVGKGITFDSGGLSIKTADGMMTMKTDMSGGAAVVATMSVLRALGVRTRVTGIVPAAENMPSGSAIRPGDVLRARNGRTIEVLNTDAEGRLVLADGLSLAVEAGPDAIIDIATLTGAQVVALGKKIAAVIGNDDALVEQVRDAAERAGEPAWPLPLADDYRSHIESEVADVKNMGNPGQAGTIIGGLFLKEFVGDVPWAHLDIAGPARADKDEGYLRQGGTGFGVRTLVELVSSWRSPRRG